MKQNNNNEMSLIEKFFSYELNDAELDRFEQLNTNDPTFRAKVESYRIAKGYVQEKYFPEQQALLAQKRQELEQLNPLKKRSPRPILQRLLMAASVLLLLGAAFWLFNKPAPPSTSIENQALVIAQNTTNLDLLELSVRSGQASEKNELWEAVQAKDWPLVTRLSTGLSDDDPALAIAAIADYHQGNYARALQGFNKCKIQNNGIEDNLLWWLTATHLQLQQKEQARQLLEEIISKDFPSASQAKTLLQQIKYTD